MGSRRKGEENTCCFSKTFTDKDSKSSVAFEYTIALTLLCAYIQGNVCSSCPENFFGFTEVLTCLHNITLGHNGFNILAGTPTEAIQNYCHDGTFNKSVTCLNGLYTECQNPKSIAWLKTIAKPYLWQQGINSLCNNLQLHARYNDCIVLQRNASYQCLMYNDEMFVKQTTEPTRSRIAFNICRYYKGMRLCTGRQVRDKCDVSIGRLLENYIHTITPLLCDEEKSILNASGYKIYCFYNYSLTSIIASLIICMNLHGLGVR